MPLTIQQITACPSDEALFDLLSAELNQRLAQYSLSDGLVEAMRQLSPGLRAMAAIHRLDISMAMDDLGWHFHNFPHRGYADETLLGLRELGADEAAEIFAAARALIEPHWNKLDTFELDDFQSWYASSGVEAAMRPLNDRLWKICARSPHYGLMQFWLDYARKHPERVAG